MQQQLATQRAEWVICNANSALGTALPTAPGLYMFVWRPSLTFVTGTERQETLPCVLYIGKASNLRHRFSSEYKHLLLTSIEPNRDQHSRSAVLAHYFRLQPLEYWYTQIDDISQLRLIETELIRIIDPPTNNHHASRGRPAF